MKHLLIDGNNLLFANQMAQKSKLMAGEQETTAIFGTLNSIRRLLEPKHFAGYTPTILWDSPEKTWRHIEYTEYKAGRDKNPLTAEAKEAVKSQRPLVQEMAAAIGILSLEATGFEADDIAGLLAQRISSKPNNMVALATSDQDWLQLVNEQCCWFDPRADQQRLITNSTFELQTGYRNPDAFLFGKALVGDTSDNFPGVGGIGKGTAPHLTYYFASFEELVSGWDALSETIKPGHELSRAKKKIQGLLDNEGGAQEIFKRNLRMMDLRSVSIPTNKMVATRGIFNQEEFIRLCKRYAMASIYRDFDTWVGPFINKE